MKVDCPYDQWALTMAGLGANRKLEEYEQAHGEGSVNASIEAFTNGLPKSGTPEYKQAVATMHGIGVIDLINSPNYEKLVEEYDLHLFDQLKKSFTSTFSLTDAETWAILYAGFKS